MNLIIIHLVNSLKSKQEIIRYIADVRLNHSPKGVTHLFSFGGDPKFDNITYSKEFPERIYLNPEDLSYINDSEFKCSDQIKKSIEYIAQYASFNPNETYVNIRDMDDKYDTNQMVKELPMTNNVGIIRFNELVNGVESPYGRFRDDYFIESFTKIKGIKTQDTLVDRVMVEPHMIHRQFALCRLDVLKKYVEFHERAFEDDGVNEGEDTRFLFGTYLASMYLGLGIKVCGSVNIGSYERNAGSMSDGAKSPINRFSKFCLNIGESVTNLMVVAKNYFDQDQKPHLFAFAHAVIGERAVGNYKSYLYHSGKSNE